MLGRLVALVVALAAVACGFWPVHSWWFTATLFGMSTHSGSFKLPSALAHSLDGTRPVTMDPEPVDEIPKDVWRKRINSSYGWIDLMAEIEWDGRPRVIRGAVADELQSFDKKWWVQHFGSHPMKLITPEKTKRYAVVPNRPLNEALHESEPPYLLQGLNMHTQNKEWLSAVGLHFGNASFTKWDQWVENTALTFNKEWDYHFHAHPDSTVNFCLSGRKRFVFMEPNMLPHFRPTFSTISALSTPNSIKFGGPAQWKHLPRWEVFTKPGDLVIFPAWTFHAVESHEPSKTDDDAMSFLWSPIRISSAFRAQPLMTMAFFIRFFQTLPLATVKKVYDAWREGTPPAEAFVRYVYQDQGDVFGDESEAGVAADQ